MTEDLHRLLPGVAAPSPPRCRLIRRAAAAIGARLAGRDESGAVLILALVFLVVASLSLVGLVTFSGSGLLNTANLKKLRALEYASNSATDIAIQGVRYSGDAYDTATGTPVATPQNCLGPTSVGFSPTGRPTSSPTARVENIAVDCQGEATSPLPVNPNNPTGAAVTAGSTTVTTTTLFAGSTSFVGYEITDAKSAIPPTTVVVHQDRTTGTVTLSAPATATATGDTLTLYPTVERVVTFFACTRSGSSTPPCSATHYLVRATVEFNDVSPTHGFLCGAATSTGPPATPTCGSSMSVKQWLSSYANH